VAEERKDADERADERARRLHRTEQRVDPRGLRNVTNLGRPASARDVGRIDDATASGYEGLAEVDAGGEVDPL
jgi:hypothetical protein